MTLVDPVASLAVRCKRRLLRMRAPNRDQGERVAMRSAILPRENAAPWNPILKGNDRWPNAAS